MNAKQGSSKHLLLKIFSGPHMGAEMLLGPGDYIIGRSSECDIVLQDESICEKHATVFVSSKGVSIKSLNKMNIFSGGVAIDQEKDSFVNLYQMLKIGTTQFAFGMSGGEWHSLHSTSDYDISAVGMLDVIRVVVDRYVQSFRMALAQINATYFSGFNFHPAGDAALLVPDSLVNEYVDEHVDEHVGGHVAGTEIKLLNNASQNKKHNKPNSLTLVIFLALAVFVVVSTFKFTALFFDVGKNQGAFLMTPQLNALFDMPEYSGLSFVALKDSEALVTGYVATADDRRKFIESIDSFSIKTTINIRVGSELVDSAKNILAVSGLAEIKVKYLSSGELTVAGYVANRHDWDRAKTMLLDDIMGLKGVNDTEIEDFFDRKGKLVESIKKQELTSKLKLSRGKSDELVVHGMLGPEEMEIWQVIETNFDHKYQYRPIIESHVSDTRDILDLDIKSVHMSAVPYITTGEGGRYLTGATLPNGFKLIDVRNDSIILSRYGVDAVYRLVD